MKFVDRSGTDINLRKLKIMQGNFTDSELIVKIERAETSVTEEGTPINAETFNQWNELVDKAAKDTEIMQEKISKLLLAPDYSDANNHGTATVELLDGKLKFSNLKGADGEKYAITEAHGLYAFRVTEDGDLCVNYSGDNKPNFTLQDDELIFNFEE